METEHGRLKCHQFSFNAISVFRGETLACKALSASLQAGDILVIQGHNGSGKTSLLKALAGLLPVYHGEISINGQLTQIRQRYPFINYLSADDTLKSNLTVSETLAYQLLLENKLPNVVLIQDLLAQLKLSELKAQLVGTLSSGEKKRLQLAPLFWRAQPIMLLDEPFVFLDSDGKAIFKKRIEFHCETGGIVLVSTHEGIDFARQQQLLRVN